MAGDCASTLILDRFGRRGAGAKNSAAEKAGPSSSGVCVASTGSGIESRGGGGSSVEAHQQVDDRVGSGVVGKIDRQRTARIGVRCRCPFTRLLAL